jgi:hypothetical protein
MKQAAIKATGIRAGLELLRLGLKGHGFSRAAGSSKEGGL